MTTKASCVFTVITNSPSVEFGSCYLTCPVSSAPLSQHWDISQTKIRVISTLLFVLFGCLLFVALPAAIFKHIEGWSVLESLYFVVITLTTIGFGDFVAGTNTKPMTEEQNQTANLNLSVSLPVSPGELFLMCHTHCLCLHV